MPDLVLVRSVEDGVGDLALPGAILGLKHGLGTELGLALLRLLVLLKPRKRNQNQFLIAQAESYISEYFVTLIKKLKQCHKILSALNRFFTCM